MWKLAGEEAEVEEAEGGPAVLTAMVNVVPTWQV